VVAVLGAPTGRSKDDKTIGVADFAGCPILLLCLARSELLDERPMPGRGGGVRLEPLVEADGRALL
jgi:hypothetical protein